VPIVGLDTDDPERVAVGLRLGRYIADVRYLSRLP
jgi:hypothetical protein